MEPLVLDIPSGKEFLEKIEAELSDAWDLKNFKIVSLSVDLSKIRIVAEERETHDEPR